MPDLEKIANSDRITLKISIYEFDEKCLVCRKLIGIFGNFVAN